MSKTRILLVDDHELIRAGLRAILDRQNDIEVVAEASDASDGFLAACREQPDILILDLTMPKGGSLDLIRKLQEKGLPTRVLVLSMHDEPAYARAAIAAGALGYVVKTISEQDLLGALRSVIRGHLIVDLDDEAKTASIFSNTMSAARSKGKNALTKLSERELEVLALLGQGHGNQAIAELLDISPKTVATYRARIGEKLGLKTTPDYVKYVVDTGLIMKRNLPQ